MPSYDFLCRECFATRAARVADWTVTTIHCEECGGVMDKQPSAPAFHLKGAGWSKDGYGKKGSR